MTKTLSIATVVSVGGLISIGLVGASFGYLMLRENLLVGLVPFASSILLVGFGGLSLIAKDREAVDVSEAIESPARRWATPVVMVLLVIYLLAIDVVGFDLDTTALIILVFLTSGVRRPLTIGLTLAVLLAVAFLFQSVLGIELPKGVF